MSMKKYLLPSVLLASVLFPVAALAQTTTQSPQSYCSAIYLTPLQASEECQTQQDYADLQSEINGVLSWIGNSQSDQQGKIYLQQDLKNCWNEINTYNAITDPSTQILWQKAEECQTNQDYVLVQGEANFASNAVIASGGNASGTTQPLLTTCKQGMTAYSTAIQDYDTCVPQEQQNQANAQIEASETVANYCTTTYGQYAQSGSSSTTCTCQQGYEFLDNHSACVSYSSYCDVKYGQNAIANSDGTCSISCPTGATYNSSTQVCVMQASMPVISTPIPVVAMQPQPPTSLPTVQIPSVSTQINPVVSHHTATTHSASAPLPITANATTTVVTATSSPIGSTTAITVTATAPIPSANVPVVPTPEPSFLTILENLISRLNPFSWF